MHDPMVNPLDRSTTAMMQDHAQLALEWMLRGHSSCLESSGESHGPWVQAHPPEVVPNV